ncbi:MAG: hypothetical protein CL816_04555 [Coxiellaceae bacterium]|nr:hypothetical protein [Coxiellaceae bacterium]
MQPIPFNPQMTADFFTASGKPSLVLKIRQKQSPLTLLSPSQVKAFIEALPIGVYQYVIIEQSESTHISSYYLKVGCANHALLALSDDQAKQSINHQVFNDIIHSIHVLAAGDIHKTQGYCYLTDQSGGYHRSDLSRDDYLDHQKLLSNLSLLSYPFNYFSTVQSCEKVMNVLSSHHLQLIIFQKHRVLLYLVLEKLAVMSDASLSKCLADSLNNQLVLLSAKKILLTRQVTNALSICNIYQEATTDADLHDKIPKRPAAIQPSQYRFFRRSSICQKNAIDNKLMSETRDDYRI